ncbi:disease resistance protein L6-like [Rutidosis leptorrhynchoides]|uniref:disease resistance protein L6-like n=1 Tax=Rutidosis leptorrhynchoides TaxID=125765 RepID=UPI003A99F9A6
MDRGQSQGKRERAEEESIEGASTFSFNSPVPIDVCNGQYDVFMSFRGSDTRKAFADHLYHSLIKAGTVPICVFRDDNSILIGEEFGSQILDAITRSKILILIISENYASSKWCLRELTHIMDCKKRTSQMALPIFYKVDPSDVRYLKGSFGEAFHLSKKHFDEKDIQEGLRSLREVSDLHGWESEKFANGYFAKPFSFFDKHEGELVEKVVENIMSKLRQDFQLDVTKHLVGIGDHVNKIRKWVDTPTSVARMIGIYGMGGIGKTTLAKVIYNQLSDDFVHRSFLADIRETAHRNNMPYLQKQLIKDILQIEHQVGNVDYGISLIKSRFKRKKVLILLDDVDDKNQLDALARERDWFMLESMIIVTTRNEAILDQSEFEVDYKYELNELDGKRALLLFNRHAFRMDHSPGEFEGISRDIISNMGGLPLALQVVGSYLYKKTNRNVWEDVREQLKNEPHRDVQKTLQISYDALQNEHKQIFLDIACFLVGEVSRFAMYMWEDCGLYPSQGIEELKLRCLIKIGDHAASRTSNDELLSEVRWLKWRVVQSDLSLSMHLSNLSVLDLSWSEIREYWQGWRSFMASKRLKVLMLIYCHNLRRTPDLSAFTQLKILILSNCDGLEHLHPSIGKLMNLVSLNLHSCKRLKELPKEVGELKDLEELFLGSSGITEIPMSIGSLRKLKTLSAPRCYSLTEIPSSIGDLQNLQHLDLSYSTIKMLPSAIGSGNSRSQWHIDI